MLNNYLHDYAHEKSLHFEKEYLDFLLKRTDIQYLNVSLLHAAFIQHQKYYPDASDIEEAMIYALKNTLMDAHYIPVYHANRTLLFQMALNAGHVSAIICAERLGITSDDVLIALCCSHNKFAPESCVEWTSSPEQIEALAVLMHKRNIKLLHPGLCQYLLHQERDYSVKEKEYLNMCLSKKPELFFSALAKKEQLCWMSHQNMAYFERIPGIGEKITPFIKHTKAHVHYDVLDTSLSGLTLVIANALSHSLFFPGVANYSPTDAAKLEYYMRKLYRGYDVRTVMWMYVSDVLNVPDLENRWKQFCMFEEHMLNNEQRNFRQKIVDFIMHVTSPVLADSPEFSLV